MRLPLLSLLFVSLAAAELPAQVTQFPYRAEIEANGVDVRSGPGRKYYVTNKLNRGAQVIVFRHDPGGQYMIAPPNGSFSWIPQRSVKRVNDHIGVLTEPNVSVRIGSMLAGEHDIEQIRLSTGDRVEILGVGQVDTPDGPAQMFKITPPQGEWRWVAGQFVTPTDPTVRRQQDHDPFAVPSQVKSSLQAEPQTGTDDSDSGPSKHETDLAEQAADLTPDAAVVPAVVDAEELDADRAALKQLDVQFAQMVDAAEPHHWNLDGLEAAYRQLLDNAASTAFASQVEMRLQAVARYRDKQARFVEFIQLTSETSRREAEYVSLLHQQEEGQQVDVELLAPEAETVESVETFVESSESGPLLTLEEPIDDSWQPVRSVSSGESEPTQEATDEGWVPAEGELQHAAPMPPPSPSDIQSAPSPGFDVAGIVHRSRLRGRGAPSHVLVAPNGQVIAFLQGGRRVPLDRYLGRSVGIHGERMRRRGLRSDFIVVQGVEPVQMRR